MKKLVLIPIAALGIASYIVFIGLLIFNTWSLVIKPITTYQSAKNWEQCTCKVEENKIIPKATGKSNYGLSSYRDHINLTYSYSVGEKRLSGSNLDLTFNTKISTNKQRNLAKELAKVKEIDCFYNPNKPSESVINRDFPLSLNNFTDWALWPFFLLLFLLPLKHPIFYRPYGGDV